MDLGENGDGDDFQIDVDDAIEGRSARGGAAGAAGRGGRGGRGAREGRDGAKVCLRELEN